MQRLRILFKKWWFIFPLFIVLIQAIVVFRNFPVDTDYIADFLILKDYRLGDMVWLTPDNFIMKFPFILFFSSLFGYTFHTLEYFMVFQTLVCVGLFFFCYVTIVKKVFPKVSLLSLSLPLFYFASGSTDFFIYLVHTRSRNLEIGMVFLLIYFAFRYIDGSFYIQRLKEVLLVITLVILSVLLLYSDPFFIYTVYIPTAIILSFGALLSVSNRWAFVRITLLLILSISVYFVLKQTLNASGFYSYFETTHILDSNKLFLNGYPVIYNLLGLFNANMFEVPKFTFVWFERYIHFSLLFISLFSWVSVGFSKAVRHRYFLLALTLIPLGSVVINLISKNVEGLTTGRYLILLPFFLCFALVYFLTILRVKKSSLYFVIVAILAVGIFGNIYENHQHSSLLTQRENFMDREAMEVIKQEKIPYGYGQYWSAGLLTYFSYGQFTMRPIQCTSSFGVIPFYWLINKKWFESEARTGSTFLLVERTNKYMRACSSELLMSQFGKPIKKVQMKSGKELYIWDYNIATRLPKRTRNP